MTGWCCTSLLACVDGHSTQQQGAATKAFLSVHVKKGITASAGLKPQTFLRFQGVKTSAWTPPHLAALCAGRETPGKAYRLYTEASFAGLPPTTPPEITRVNLGSVVLQLKVEGCWVCGSCVSVCAFGVCVGGGPCAMCEKPIRCVRLSMWPLHRTSTRCVCVCAVG